MHFGSQCAYCHTPTLITGGRPVVDHIVPRAAGGQTVPENLCPACHACNESKGSQTRAPDPQSGEVAALFHSRQQPWRDHFRWSEDGTLVVGLTPTGRATIAGLDVNHAGIVDARRLWVRVGWHHPAEDR